MATEPLKMINNTNIFNPSTQELWVHYVKKWGQMSTEDSHDLVNVTQYFNGI